MARTSKTIAIGPQYPTNIKPKSINQLVAIRIHQFLHFGDKLDSCWDKIPVSPDCGISEKYQLFNKIDQLGLFNLQYFQFFHLEGPE